MCFGLQELLRFPCIKGCMVSFPPDPLDTTELWRGQRTRERNPSANPQTTFFCSHNFLTRRES